MLTRCLGDGKQMHWYQELLWRWPDLVITGLGVLLGAFFAFAIERKRTHHEQAIAERLDRERLEAHMERVKIEVRDNKQYVDKMIGDVLDKAPQANSPARIEFLKWAATLADPDGHRLTILGPR